MTFFRYFTNQTSWRKFATRKLGWKLLMLFRFAPVISEGNNLNILLHSAPGIKRKDCVSQLVSRHFHRTSPQANKTIRKTDQPARGAIFIALWFTRVQLSNQIIEFISRSPDVRVQHHSYVSFNQRKGWASKIAQVVTLIPKAHTMFIRSSCADACIGKMDRYLIQWLSTLWPRIVKRNPRPFLSRSSWSHRVTKLT